MMTAAAVLDRLREIPGLAVHPQARLADFTRFRLGGPALAVVSTTKEGAFVSALEILQHSTVPWTTLAGGTNLVVSDAGYPGIVVQYANDSLQAQGTLVIVGAGAELNALIDFANVHGLTGMESMAGIPGWTGAAIYGNAGAYGQSISDRIEWVRFADGALLREFSHAECEFRYRSSIFKQHKDWQILSAGLRFEPANAAELAARSAAIRATRDEKFPPTMLCAGSIFKNLLLRELPAEAASAVPAHVVKGGKVPAAWFLDQVGARGMKQGGIEVAPYHANLVFNAGDGTASELVALLMELKDRVESRFGIRLEEEVQFLGPVAVASPPAPEFVQ